MNPDTPFLEAIRSDPKDAALRLVYADWLEERGDPRAELIRIEEEMRPLPVFSDRFWQLKPRRHELHQSLPKGWLETMLYGTDCPPTFAHMPNGWKEWWRLIRVFTERWYGTPLLPDVGGRSAEIQATEQRLGLTLPPSVGEWVAFAHDLNPAPETDSLCVFRDMYQMQELEGHPALSLLLQCEGDYHWAVHHSDLGLLDPPVHGYGLDYEGGGYDSSSFMIDGRRPVDETLTSFVLGYALTYTHAPGGGFGTDLANSDELTRELKLRFPVHFEFGNTEIFETENIVVRLNDWNNRQYIRVDVFKPLLRELIPQVLWDCTRNGGMFYGMFK